MSAWLCRALAVLAGVTACVPAMATGLQLEAAHQDGRPLDCIPSVTAFALGFIHSVSMTPVRDDYRLRDGRITQVGETFQAHGAGLPSGLDEAPDALAWTQDGEGFHLTLDRAIEDLVVRVDPDYGNALQVDGQSIDLSRWGRMAIRLRPVPDCDRQRGSVSP